MFRQKHFVVVSIAVLMVALLTVGMVRAAESPTAHVGVSHAQTSPQSGEESDGEGGALFWRQTPNGFATVQPGQVARSMMHSQLMAQYSRNMQDLQEMVARIKAVNPRFVGPPSFQSAPIGGLLDNFSVMGFSTQGLWQAALTPVNAWEGIDDQAQSNLTSYLSSPPDVNGDIGQTYYVEAVNKAIAVYNRSGSLQKSWASVDLWSSLTNCSQYASGDPVVLYDHDAQRWLITEMAFSTNTAGDSYHYLCFAVSQTSDPTGSWYTYEFTMPTNILPDYPKYGIWVTNGGTQNGYYFTYNGFNDDTNLWDGVGIMAVERDKMLTGAASPQLVGYHISKTTDPISELLPAHWEGTWSGATKPPDEGDVFIDLRADEWGYAQDSLEIYQLTVDWTNGTATYTDKGSVALDSFAPAMPSLCSSSDQRQCIPQKDTTNKLDVVGDRPMFPLLYRNLGGNQGSFTFTVTGTDGNYAYPVWFEVREDHTAGTFSIAQQGDLSSLASDGLHRWMGVMAQDKYGNMLLAYSTSGSTIFPQLRYTGRLVCDTAGSMPVTEGTFASSSTFYDDNTSSDANRWGDYFGIGLDPTDGVTFWAVGEYVSSTLTTYNWATRVGVFRFETDLQVSKSAPASVAPNENFAYTVTVTNAGPSDACGVTMTDTLPNGVTFVSATASTGSCAYDAATHAVQCDLGRMNTSDTATITINVTAPATAGTLTNTATVEGSISDSDTSNNTATATTDVVAADLSLSKTLNNATPSVGDTVTFTLTVTNDGPNDTTGVKVTDVLPSGYTFVSATASTGTYDSTTGLWDVGALANGSNATLTLQATVNASGDYTNTAEITASDASDPDSTPANGDTSEDDYASAAPTSVTPVADLSLSKTLNNATPSVGDTVTFTVTVSNGGPSNATGVKVTDALPNGYTFVSATPSAGTYDSATGVWDVGTVANGGNATLTLQATVNASGNYTNAAEVTASDADDPDSTPNNGDVTEDDYASAAPTSVTPSADLSLTKTMDNTTPSVGDTVTFTITVTNDGPSDATGVKVTDALPSGYTFVSATATVGSYDSATGVWDVGALANASSATLTLKATMNASGDYTNVAEVTASDVDDPDSTPNNGDATEDDYADAAPTNVTPSADLSLSKTLNNATPSVGDTVTFTLTVSNGGPSTATGVKVTDALPSGYTFVSASPSVGTYDSSTGVWNVGTLSNGSNATLTLQATVNASGDYTNTAEVTASDADDPDSTPGNGNTSEDDYASAAPTSVTPVADLSLSKALNNATPAVGDTVTFTLTVSNDGPSDATGVQVTDALPSGYTFVSATPSTGTYDSATGVWDVGAVANGSNATLTLQATVNASGDYTNVAEITASGVDDPDSTPNNGDPTEDDYASAAPTSVRPTADLSLTKTLNNATPSVGDTVTFTVMVTNSGPSDATGVKVTDVLPNGYTFVNASASVGTYDSSTGVWDLGALANGDSATLTLQATLKPSGNYTNAAEITASDANDPDSTPANGDATEDDYDTAAPSNVAPVADLSLTKTVSANSVAVGDQVVFVLTLTNDGPSDATGVQVTDTLPGGYTFISATASTGTYDSSTGVWNVGTIAASHTETLSLTVRVNANGSYTNVAEVTASDAGDPDSTPNNGDPTEDDYASAGVINVTSRTDIMVDKQASNLNPVPGEIVTFTITVMNASTASPATSVAVFDYLGDGYAYVENSAQATQGTITVVHGSVETTWDVGSLAPGATATLTLQAQVLSSPRDWSAWVRVVNVTPSDWQVENNYDAISVHPRLPQTGFAPHRVTVLPPRPEGLAYATTGLWLEIPSLGVMRPIVGVPGGETAEALTWLGDQVGYIESTTFPTWKGNTVLTAHNYLPSGLPGPFVNLEALRWGDVIRIHYAGQVYEYEVRSRQVVSPSVLWPFKAKPHGTWLTLITCRQYDEQLQAYRYRVVVQAVLMRVYPEP